MARIIFIAHHHKDKNQVKGFILLRWNKNVEFTFFDRSLVDPVSSDDENYIKKCIREEMKGTSVTVVLIGEKTYNSKWVRWEVEESIDRKNGLLGIKLKGKSDAKTPTVLKKNKIRIIFWNPNIFEEAIEEAATIAGR